MDQQALLDTLERLCNLPREGGTVEFKLNWDHAPDIGQYISALGNAAALEGRDRAWMVWGVDNATHEIQGSTFNPFTAKGEGNQPLSVWLTQKIVPRPDFQFHELIHQKGRVVLLEIHPPRSAPLAFDGVRYIRIDSNKANLTKHPDKEARLWAVLGQKDDWSGELVPGATLDDLDPAAIESARKRFAEYLTKNEQDSARHNKIRADVQVWDVLTLLNKAHVTKQGRITRSALLLLGKDESSHYLSPADTKISWILRDEHNRAISSHHFGMPLLLSSVSIFGRIRNITLEYMPDGTLFPTPIPQYDSWVIREALHNCVAHQDYGLGGKINVVEHPDRLVFTNLGVFIPPSVQWMLEHQSPPEHYRNQWLIDGMVRLRMIDQIGSGIRRMFETQRERFFPMPDYLIDPDSQQRPRIEVSISGKILDANYTRTLMKRPDLRLREVFLLDRVQKHQKISHAEAKLLKAQKLIEGRSPNYFVSAKVADWAGQKARYIRTRGLDDGYYQRLVLEFLEKYQQASRKELDDLLSPKLPEILDSKQKYNKIRNLLQAMRRSRLICRSGSRSAAVWRLGAEKTVQS